MTQLERWLEAAEQVMPLCQKAVIGTERWTIQVRRFMTGVHSGGAG